MKFRIILRCFFVAAACLALFCAHQVPPTGGPDDKTPPKVAWASPPLGSKLVPVKSVIVFKFTKWINTQNADKCLAVFPTLKGGIKISVSGRKVLVKPKRAFSDSTTYHIVFNTTLSDLHGNSIGTPYQYYFSTGPTIDSGRVFGCVVAGEGKAIQPKVALFTRSEVQPSDTVLFGMPSYLTQTDSAGVFSFDNIHRGTYEVLAFSDDNGNNKIDPLREAVFAPITKRFTLDKVVGPLVLFGVVCDTTTRHISTLRPLSATCIGGEWIGGTGMPDSAYADAWRAEATESKRQVLIKQYLPVYHTQRFVLLLSDTLGLAPFRLVYRKQSPLLFGKGVVQNDTILFNGLASADTAVPVVKGSDPQSGADVRPVVRIFWSKPVTCRASKWYCEDTLGAKADLGVSQRFCDTTFLFAKRSLTPGMAYEVSMPDSLFADAAGNTPKDTAGVTLKFRTTADQDLCLSLSGGASCLKGDSLRTWQFLPLGKQKAYLTADRAGSFRFDTIPSGKGRIAYFLDVNRDGKPTPGSLVPWVPPEEYRIFPDTVEARARWDVEGISVPAACELCAPKIKPKTPPEEDKKK
ncbi:MAG TPA: Ig-like domain-containing protein [Chitinivibrionales bacterium]|nr:Ig-like domain-containing protein [Chitinivibrionales bacterium]